MVGEKMFEDIFDDEPNYEDIIREVHQYELESLYSESELYEDQDEYEDLLNELEYPF